MTIKEYWNLIGREQFLAITWEPDFSRACNFRRMLMNHKNFRFTQIPDKTNDMIFLKSPKTLFLGQFWPFLFIFAWWWFFPKNPAVTGNYICAPNIMLSFRKKLMSQFLEKVWTDEWKDRLTRVATLFMRWKLRRFEKELQTFLRIFVKTLHKIRGQLERFQTNMF